MYKTILCFILLDYLLHISVLLGIGHEEDVDTEQLPDAVPKGNFAAEKLPADATATLVVFNLETTYLSK